MTVTGGVATAAAFVPTDIAGLVAWYDFSDVTKLWQDTGRTSAISADGQSIKGVTDKAAANHLSQASAAPVYKANIKNGLSIARFTAASSHQLLTGTSPTVPNGTAPFTAFFVASRASSADMRVVGRASGSGGWAGGALGGATTARVTTLTVKDYDFVGGWTLSTFHVQEFVLDSSQDVTWRKNGTSLGTAAHTAFAADPGTAAATVGSRNGADFWDGDIAEVLVYNVDIGTTASSQVRSFLGTKWGITVV